MANAVRRAGRGIQRGEEIADGFPPGMVAGDAVAIEAQRFAVRGQQQIPPPLCRAVRARFQQQRIALRREAMQ